MAELALGFVGAGIAGIPGLGLTAFQGFQIGATLGSILFPNTGPPIDNGKLEEVRIQNAQQGSPIPIIYGRNRTAGTIIWATGVTETVTSSGGKGGGPRVNEYTYTTSLAVVVCEGSITKIRRIWANEKVIYDFRSGGSPTVADFIDSSKIRVYDGTQTSADSAIEADKGVGNVPAHKGLAYVVFEDIELAEFGNQVPNFNFEVESVINDLEEVMNDLCGRVGLDSGDYDFSNLSSYNTRGLIVPARTEASRVMDALAKANRFDIVETGGQLKAVIRDGTSVATIPSDDVGAGSDTDAKPFVEITRLQEVELPESFQVSYNSELQDFQQFTQSSRRNVRFSQNQSNVSFPMSLTDSYAKFLSDSFLIESWIGRQSFKFTLPYKYMYLDPGDVITVPNEAGSTNLVRIESINNGLVSELEVVGVADDPIIYSDPGFDPQLPTVDDGEVITGTVATFIVDEVNAPYDEFAIAGNIFCVAGRPESGWNGGQLYADPSIKEDAGPIKEIVGSFLSSCVFGKTTADSNGVLEDDATPLAKDTVNTVRVTLTSGTLESVSESDITDMNKNLAVIGKEIVNFQTATFISGTTWELSNIYRYKRGTDYLLSMIEAGEFSGHAQQDNFVLITSKNLPFAYDVEEVGNTKQFYILEYGRDYSGGLPSSSNSIDLEGTSRKPYGPTSLAYVGDRSSGDADVTISWVRRSRTKGDLTNWDSAPMDEAIEQYKVEIWDASVTTLLRTMYTTSKSIIYSIADQTTDGVNSSTFKARVFQISDVSELGYGHPSLFLNVPT